jgi:hypothetical protein
MSNAQRVSYLSVLTPGFLFATVLFASPFSIVKAQSAVCSPACQSGYTCVTDVNLFNGEPTCKQNDAPVQEITVTAPSKTTTTTSSGTFATIVQNIENIVNSYVLPLLYAFAFLFFVAGLARYFFVGQGEEAQKKGKQMAIYGLIGLVVLFGVWGIVNVVLSTVTSVAGVGTS